MTPGSCSEPTLTRKKNTVHQSHRTVVASSASACLAAITIRSGSELSRYHRRTCQPSAHLHQCRGSAADADFDISGQGPELLAAEAGTAPAVCVYTLNT